MAITHFTPQLISRGSGRSAVAAAAYRHCARMEHEGEGRVIDYSRKPGMVHEEFVLPPNAPVWARTMIADRSVAGAAEAFWNRVENFEKRADAQLAKEFILALPVELTTEQNIALMRAFVSEQVLARGIVADWVYHDVPGNPHVHLMTSLRPLTEDGFGAKKVPVIGDDGAVVRTKSRQIVYQLWAGDKDDFLALRQAWYNCQNQHLALNGHDVRVDGRSYAERGIDIAPTIHIGVAAKAIQRQAEYEGRAAELDRLRVFEAQRQKSARKIERNPAVVLDIVAQEKSVFDERDLAKVVHRYIDGVSTFNTIMARVVRDPEIVRLERERVDLDTGEVLRSRYTTRALIRIEAEMAEQALRLTEGKSFAVEREVVQSVFHRHARLSAEQRSAIEHVTGHERIAAVVGRAGAGKTTMMTAAREVWETAGYRVVGAALAGKAAEGLEKEAGIESRTLSSWQLRWSKGRDLLDEATVFVLDEAGMVSSRQMAEFVAAVSTAGAKLVLVGDPEQLQPIEAGAAFRALVDRIGYAELENIYRQKQQWMRDASLDFARGNVREAMTRYTDQGRVLGSVLKTEAVAALIVDWNRDYDPAKSTLILAHLRRDVRALNDLARAKLIERGLIEAGHVFRTEDGKRRFAAGDQIVFLKNEGSLGVKNGMIARVVEAGPGRIVAEIGDGPVDTRHRVEVEQRFYRNIDHGYATTIHKSQGATVDQVKVLATLSLDKHLTYVAMTRHREDVALYFSSKSFDKVGGLIKVLSQRNAKETTLDYHGSRLYSAALRYATTRGLHAVRVARTLVSDRRHWISRQKVWLEELAGRLAAIGVRIGVVNAPPSPTPLKSEPMILGIGSFAKTIADVVEERLLADTACKRQWEEVSDRFRNTYSDPTAALSAMKFDAVIKDPEHRNAVLQKLEYKLASFGALKGKSGLLASRHDRAERSAAEQNGLVLRVEIERYLRVRASAMAKIEAEEKRARARVRIDIPALTPEAAAMLEKVRDAIDRNDLPAALGFALSNKMVKAELDGFNTAISARFGDRAFLGTTANQPDGPALNAMAAGFKAGEREKLINAWPMMRAAQKVAAHEKTEQAIKERQALEQQRTVTRGLQ
ncbi:Ti-type conjugative transfer relaxase TraA [Devosia neptuniae]|uniref:Ti-type conjugative transfer relaxase TraA n=1 Tax=Devosia neptuniae TaxID=191302 RepID=UPI0022B0529B|nr:Ti-type conjugative transfer relaxase TraA [Devosia neptuniae]MCZ4348012.1 Ti-type conjugative transfer relaxase TraA [Devosia neptuniae]